MTTTRVILSFPWSNSSGSEKGKGDFFQDTGVTDAVMNVARKELREDKTIREQSLQQMREWIRQNQDIENVRTDDLFLLRFLRTKKFSVFMAEQMLLKYLNLRKTHMHLLYDLDFLSPKLNKLINNGYMLSSPVRDKSGRRLIIGFARNFNPAENDSSEMSRIHSITYETLMDDPQNQILGIVHVGDFRGITTAHVSCWNPTDFLRMMKWGEQSVPMRHKEVHLVNVPSAVKYVIEAGKSMISKKMKERLQVHVTVHDLCKKVDPAALPKELGGKIPLVDMIDSWKQELAAKRSTLLALDKMNILSDRGIISRNSDRNNNSNGQSLEAMTGSFRKLEVD
ncbi:clavesin-2 [Topomyia yanbarensis]|uniref:clavesin-2 n=1 Tax=Topomyia yanbarensis TaxID=2498891 RepID=UPI00273B4C8D|nr:clavesin-2 [Topomyia yanbarensis]XP_058829769.1 clavesin-2 [Topomyia yanbarensis]